MEDVLNKIEFTNVGDIVEISDYRNIVKLNFKPKKQECHNNAYKCSLLKSVWDTDIEYVEGLLSGFIWHSFNRCLNDKGEYVYFDITPIVGKSDHYAERAFTSDEASKVFSFYGMSFNTIRNTKYKSILIVYDENGNCIVNDKDFSVEQKVLSNYNN